MCRIRRFVLTFGLFGLSAVPLVAGSIGHPFSAGAAPVASWGMAGVVPAASWQSVATPQIQMGQSLFLERCAACHGPDASGTAQGPSILGLGAADYDFQLSTGRMPLARPGAQPVRTRPSFDAVQIEAIVAYLTSLAPGGPPIPAVQPAAGYLSRGQMVFQLNCAPCHGATGNGGAVGGQVAPTLHLATATQIAEAVRTGPGTMPVFGPGSVSDQDLNSLARYVLYLREPDDRGGASLGHAGPIIEGFVALLAGLGSVVLATRFIGTRS